VTPACPLASRPWRGPDATIRAAAHRLAKLCYIRCGAGPLRGRRSGEESRASHLPVPADPHRHCRRDGAPRMSERAMDRRRTRQAIAQLAAIVESSYDAIVSRDLGRTILTWNAAAERMFGYAAHEVIGRSMSMLVPPELEEEAARYREIVNGGVLIQPFDTVRVTKDGQRVHVSVRTSPMRDESGEIIGVSVIFRDIAERKRAEDAIRESERRLATLMDNLPGMAYRCRNDPQWTMEFLSAGCRALTGYTSEDFTSGRVAYGNLILQEDREAVWRAVQRAIASNTRFTLEYRIRNAGGEIRTVWEQGCAILGPSGQLLALEGFVRDVTETRKAESDLGKKIELTRLMEAMARAVNEARTPEVAMRACLEHVHRYGRWDIGRIVLFRTGARGFIAESLLWHGDLAGFEDFKRASEGFDYTNRSGLFVSQVLRGKRPVWIDDIQAAGGRGRLIDAVKSGLRSAFAFPVIVKGEVGAMLEFFSRGVRPVDELLLQDIEAVASQLARVVERDANEAALAQLAAIVENSNVAIISRSLDGHIVSWNRAAESMLGYAAREAVGQHIDLILPEGRKGLVHTNSERVMKGDPIEPYETERIAKDGRLVSVLVSIFPLKDRVERIVGAAFIMHDISALKLAQAALQESEKQFRELATNIPEVFWIMDAAEEAMIYVSPAYGRVWGRRWERSPITLDAWLEAVHSDDRRRVRRAMKRIASGYSEEYRIVRPDGVCRWVHDRAFPVREEGGRVRRITGIAADVTERKEIEERLRYLAHFDQLTELPNRVLFKDRLQQAIAQAGRNHRHVAVMFVDLDGFKVVNDTYGHAVADELLADVARRLKSCTRVSDTVARLGGDEFGIVLTNLNQANAGQTVAQKTIEALSRPYHTTGKEAFVSASIGLALYPWDGMDAETLTRNADTAMYKAKQLGRNNFQRYTPEMSATMQQRLMLEKHLRRAVDEDAFTLHYQPAVSLKTGRVTRVEALLRWTHPDRGRICPSDFVPLLEELGLIVRVTDRVLRTACRQANDWRAAGHGDVKVAVNVSARLLLNHDLAKHVLGIVRDTRCDPQQMELEITESFLMQNIDVAASALEELRNAGICLTLDDFGTGYSSLSHLSRFPIDAVKIDLTFVRDVPGNVHHAAITRSVIALAHNLGMRAIAEGIETREQLEFMADHDCDEIQGFYFTRPLPAADCTALLGSVWPLAFGGRPAGERVSGQEDSSR
jgi:diguanylate cyclase (GGDEF)-like protein/PAS domain S-box-containing protein